MSRGFGHIAKIVGASTAIVVALAVVPITLVVALAGPHQTQDSDIEAWHIRYCTTLAMHMWSPALQDCVETPGIVGQLTRQEQKRWCPAYDTRSNTELITECSPDASSLDDD
jgi:hypothetical protein